MEVDLSRQLKIKIGALKRIQKEYLGYQKEEEKQREKIKTLEFNNTDEYTIKKQVIFQQNQLKYHKFYIYLL